MSTVTAKPQTGPMGMSTYQWTVLLAAWLGWGFDAFDGLLFNYVAPSCVPALLHLTPGTPAAKSATLYWTGLSTSLLLVSWAAGGVLFGAVADRIGRTRTLLLTMMLYTLGTGCCALAPNIGVLVLCRSLAGLGIGGEWAAGASLVAEAVPESRRVEAGALLYTSAPAGLFLAAWVTHVIADGPLGSDPAVSWRYVFLTGLAPAVAAILIRTLIKEPARWANAAGRARVGVGELFRPENRRLTLSGFLPALVVLIMWWTCNAFISVLATGLAQASAQAHGLDKAAAKALTDHWKTLANYNFSGGGVIGTLLTIPAAKILGRRAMFAVYFALSAASLFVTFGLDHAPATRLALFFVLGLTVFGIFSSFTYYLPELFPTRLRATGAGFCYNVGRVIAAAGPFLVGWVSAQGTHTVLQSLCAIAVVPLLGLCFLPWIIETRGRTLAD